MPSIVALDIETTGLDSQKDAILEIGAVRFNERRVESEWSTLLNPGRIIPSFITQLTGINNDMVRGAPGIHDVLDDLTAFVGRAPILGHNVRFDLSFLARYGVLNLNEYLDTYELASTLLPMANRYGLGSLAQALGIPLQNAHRALDDARTTHQVYLKLYEMALDLPVGLIAEFVRLSDSIDWGASWVFGQILRMKGIQPVAAQSIRGIGRGPLFDGSIDPNIPPIEPNETVNPLDADEIAAILEAGGPFSKYFSGFEYRQQQVEMTRAVSRAFSDGYHLMVEAGTGTGKSLAYLVPAAYWALKNNQHVVISTNTINLQDQLIKKDIPDLCAALGLNLRVAVLKGRANYLCPRRFELMRQRGPENPDEMRVLAKVLVWLQESQTGDRNEINLNGPAERDAWSHICAEDDGCKTDVCIKREGGTCPFYRSRLAAQRAHLIVVNHALLLADSATDNRVLPEYNYVILDEAHHLESATTNAMSFKVTEGDLNRLMREIGSQNSGILGRFVNQVKPVLKPSEFAALDQLIQKATDLAFKVENYNNHFFVTVDQFLIEQREGRPIGVYAQQERILPATRAQPSWTEVEMAWDQLHDALKLLMDLLEKTNQEMGEAIDLGVESVEDTQGSLGNVYRRLLEIQQNLEHLVSKSDADQVCWVEIQPNGNRLSLQVAPLHIGPLMEKYLWHEKSSVILTSATLTANGEFDYLRNRLSADEADELVVGSPFDYENAALVYVVNDIPEPTDTNGHQRAVEAGLIRLSKATSGRMLVLFTSYAQLKRTSQAISQPLADAGINVYEQGEGASANTLLETFRETEKAVLLGTRSFWEGVDVPGQALSVLAIVKLPFDVPSDPIVAARSETFEDAFNEYSLPEAILRFRQGFGRLIRTQSDRGVVAILDKRVLTKKYGRAFLESLPGCTLRQGPLSDLPKQAANWLKQ